MQHVTGTNYCSHNKAFFTKSVISHEENCSFNKSPRSVCLQSHEYFLGEIVQRRRRMDYSLVQNLSEFFDCLLTMKSFPLQITFFIPMSSTCNFQLKVSGEIGF